jgi:hypothetical protein
MNPKWAWAFVVGSSKKITNRIGRDMQTLRNAVDAARGQHIFDVTQLVKCHVHSTYVFE